MKRIVLLLTVLCAPLFLANSSAHKFYVSITKIEYVQDQESLQIITKIFIDDFEDVLQERYDPDLSLDSTNDDKTVDLYIEKYLSKKLQIKANGAEVTAQYLGKEYDIETLVCYLEVTGIKELKSLEVTNEFLYELFPEQQNIVHVKKDDKRRSLILLKDESTDMLKFN
ncbi:DUF6702 family protein [Gilvibacter sediminis]|uniref:DUF6702 family protein n=1 Tax=Gilvibacter sediminis TaxID=379071 RepID=UPI0023509A40|nr:DUF6702 family protein [Gilvibacter sediminis]MDC7998563.1 hypothetical protein [Gilvibacter sediminis]